MLWFYRDDLPIMSAHQLMCLFIEAAKDHDQEFVESAINEFQKRGLKFLLHTFLYGEEEAVRRFRKPESEEEAILRRWGFLPL